MREIAWKAREVADAERAVSLSVELNNLPYPISCILLQRGIQSFEEARDFFRPDLEKLHDPFLMEDMHKAVERINRAIRENEHIILFGDYDVDGTTAVSLFYRFLKKYYANVSYYIPDRYSEGYGMSLAGIDEAVRRNARLMITLDCGIRSIDKVAYANKAGVDIIICDHHLPGSELPEAFAVLDPKRSDCKYPFKELSGCGVGFKLCQALAKENGYDTKVLFDLLDLLCVSIASDIVEIRGENRILCHHGLVKLNSDPSVGLKALLYFYTKKKDFGISDIVFYVGPRINAAGRIKHATAAVELLVEEDLEKAKGQAEGLNRQNTERQNLDYSITREALDLIENSETQRTRKSTVLFQKDWSKGVVGIVASRLIEKHYKPTIVLAEHDGTITGSARSVHGFDIHNAIASCSHLLLHYGGHFYAAGLSLLPENLEAFVEEFEKVVDRTIGADSLQPVIFYDAEIGFREMDPKFMRILKQLRPFGPANMNPVFRTDNVKLASAPQIVGNNHLKFMMEDESGVQLQGIVFGKGEALSEFSDIDKIRMDICYHAEENNFRNMLSVQLVIKDFRLHS